MSRLNELFPYKVCINLDRRPDRWHRVRQRFKLHDIREVRRAVAVDGAAVETPYEWRAGPGAFGCLQSHLASVRHAKQERLPSLLIFEDDVEFDRDFGRRFERSANLIPADWDMLFLGGSHRRQPEHLTAEIARLRGTLSTHAYALKNTVFDAFIELHSGAGDALDVTNLLLQESHRCYGFFPNLAWQEAGYSDIAAASVDPWTIRESIVADSLDVAEMLSNTAVVVTNQSECCNVLDFVVQSYLSLVPASAITVVRMPRAGKAGSVSLPDGCQLIELEENNLRTAWRAGLGSFDKSKQYFVLGSGDLYLRPGQLRAALQMCKRYPLVGAGSTVRLLDDNETNRLIESQGNWSPPQTNNRLSNPGRARCLLFTRAAANSAERYLAEHGENNPERHMFVPRMTVWRLRGWPSTSR